MATDVDVHVSDVAIISALNTPGGGVFQWRDEVAIEIVAEATANAPINDPLNAEHRGGTVGTYAAAFGFDRVGSNGHRVRAVIYNGSDHADIVELGRRPSFRHEKFSWTDHDPPGSIDVHARGTSGRAGKHILARALVAVMGAQGFG